MFEEQREKFKIEIKECNEKLLTNKNLKSANDNSLDQIRRNLANLRFVSV